MNLIGVAKPDHQYLFGEGLVFHYNPDTADRWPVTWLKRRVEIVRAGAAITSRRATVVYECRCDGSVLRIEVDDHGVEQGDWKRVPEGHAEWLWCHQAIMAVRERKLYPRPEWKYSIPPDCIAVGTRKSSSTTDVKTPIERRRHW